MKNQNGFTLIELIITILISGILAGLLADFFSLGAGTYRLVSDSHGLIQDRRILLEHMGREIRQAGSMSIKGSTDLTFTFDIDNDGTDETIRYYLSGSQLHKTVDGTGDTVVLDNISSIMFSGSSSLITIKITTGTGDISTTIQTGFLRRQSLS